MTIREFYAVTGSDYDRAIGTFRTDERLKSYVVRYFDDPNYQRLCTAVENDDIDEAFEASHALKGTTGMFFLTAMYEAVVDLVEQLRPKTEPVSRALFLNVKAERERLEEAFKNLD